MATLHFNLSDAIAILSRTPSVLESLLKDLPDNWINENEGPDTWSPYDIIGHLIHGEMTDWIPRMEKILSADDKHFEPFDRFAMFEASKGKSPDQLLAGLKPRKISWGYAIRWLKPTAIYPSVNLPICWYSSLLKRLSQ